MPYDNMETYLWNLIHPEVLMEEDLDALTDGDMGLMEMAVWRLAESDDSLDADRSRLEEIVEDCKTE